MIYSSWVIECDRLKLLMGHFLPSSSPLKSQKIKFLKNWKKLMELSLFYKCVPKITVYMMYAFWDMECDSHNFVSFWAMFCPLPHYWPWKLKFGKNVKSSWRYHPFTHVYHKWRSYDVCFLRYKVGQSKFFVILGDFYPFDPPNNPKHRNFEKMKKSMEIS